MGLGNQGHIGMSVQAAYKTATTSFDYVPFISESLTTQVEEIIQENMLSRFDEGDSQAGIITVAGEIVFEPHPILMGHFLRGVCGQASSTIVDSAMQWEFLPVQTEWDSSFVLPPYTLQVHRDVGSAWQFTDAMIHALAMEVTAGGIMKCTASVMARVSSLMDPDTPSFGAGDPWIWDQASVSLDGSGNGDFEAITVTIDNPVEGVSLLDNSKMFGRFKRSGPRTVKLSGTMDFVSQAEYNNFRANSHQPMIITMTGATEVASGYPEVLKLDMPKVRYTDLNPIITGPNRLSVSMEGNAKYDTTSSYSIRPTMVNTRLAY